MIDETTHIVKRAIIMAAGIGKRTRRVILEFISF